MSDRDRQHEKIESQEKIEHKPIDKEHLRLETISPQNPAEHKANAKYHDHKITQDHQRMVNDGLLPKVDLGHDINSFMDNMQKVISQGQKIIDKGINSVEKDLDHKGNELNKTAHQSGKKLEQGSDHLARKGGKLIDQALIQAHTPLETRNFIANASAYTYGIGKGLAHLGFNLAEHSSRQTGRALHEIAHDPKDLFQAMQLGGLGLATQIVKDNLEDIAKATSPSIEQFGSRVHKVGFGKASGEAAINLTRDTVVSARDTFDWMRTANWEEAGMFTGNKVLPVSAALIGTAGLLRGIGTKAGAGAVESEAVSGSAATERTALSGKSMDKSIENPVQKSISNYEQPTSILEKMNTDPHILKSIRGKATISGGKPVEVQGFESTIGPDGSTINSYQVNVGKLQYKCVDTIGTDGNICRSTFNKAGNKVMTETLQTIGDEQYIVQHTTADGVKLLIDSEGRRFTPELDPM